MANSLDPDQTAPIGAVCSGSTLFASILNLSVLLGIYLQQTTSTDDIFTCIFFLALYGLNGHADAVCSGSRDLYFGLMLHVHQHFVLASCKALASTCICADSPELSLLENVISTHGSLCWYVVSNNVRLFIGSL